MLDVPSMEGLDGGFALKANHDRTLGIHEHEAPAKQRLLAEVVESVVAQLGSEDLVRCQSVLVATINFSPVFLHDVAQNDVYCWVVVANKNVAVIHVERIHVRM